MKINELRDKTIHELEQLRSTLREKVHHLRARAAVKELKTVRDIRHARVDLVRVETLLQQRVSSTRAKETLMKNS